MFQFLLPLLAAMGIGGGTAAGLGTAGAAAGAGAAGASGLAGLAGAAPTLGPLAAGAATTGATTAPFLAAGDAMAAGGIAGSTLEQSLMGSLSAKGLLNSAFTGAARSSPNIFSSMFPGLTQFGKSAMGGDLSGMGGGIGKMMGSENLANMLSNPSWANLGKLGEGMGDKMVAAGVTKGLLGSPQPQPPQIMSPGSVERKAQIAPPEQITQDPVLQRMYNNLNPQFQAQPMKPWPPSPYPRRMSPV